MIKLNKQPPIYYKITGKIMLPWMDCEPMLLLGLYLCM